MADMAQFVHKFRANGDAFPNNSPSKVIKRNRQPLSCLPCRQRKLKCSRQQPCETCVKRNDESSCTYAKPIQKGENKMDASRVKAQDRLRQLEDLVMQMVETGPPNPNAVPSIPSPMSNVSDGDGTPRDGVYTQFADSSRYVGSTHWSAILENIQDLKATMGTEFGSPKASIINDPDEAELEGDTIFGAQRAIPMQQILEQYLPPRLQIDRLLSVYFNAKYMVIPYIHTYQFQRQYEEFWKDPLAVSPHWLSVLFSICCIASKLAMVGRNGGPPTPELGVNPSEIFIHAAAQCLMLGGFKPRPFVIESLALYAQCKYSQSMDPSREVGLIFSILVRLAYRMAYHRDPDNFPQFSPFEGEMRRRVWAMTRQFDLMTSFQLGLPPNVAQDSWDTKVPRNLLDSDFDEDTRALPPSRPEHEPTQILYFIIKSRLMSNFAKICSHALSFKNSSQLEIAELDRDVRETFNGVPDTLRVRSMSQSFADPPYLVMVRLNCEFLYQKSLLVLHRKYMTQGFEFSTKACIDAATAIVRRFIDIHKEFKPGGQLYQERWMLGSFTMNDYLLASMILCLALSQWRKQHPSQTIQDDEYGEELLQHLRMNYTICAEEASLSTESRRVAEALGAMLKQVCPGEQLSPIALPAPSTTDATFPSHQLPDTASDHASRHNGGNNGNSSNLNFFLAPLSLSDSTESSLHPYNPATTSSIDLSMSGITTTTSAPTSMSNDAIMNIPPPSASTNIFDPFFLEAADSDLSQIDWPTLDAYLTHGERFNPSHQGSSHMQQAHINMLQQQQQQQQHHPQAHDTDDERTHNGLSGTTTARGTGTGASTSSDPIMAGRLYPARGSTQMLSPSSSHAERRSVGRASHSPAATRGVSPGMVTAGGGTGAVADDAANRDAPRGGGDGNAGWDSAPMHFLGRDDQERVRFPL